MKRTLYLVGLSILLVACCGVAEGAAGTPTVAPPMPTTMADASATATIAPTATATLTRTATPSPEPTATQTPAPTATTPSDLAALPGRTWNVKLVGHTDLGAVGWWGSLSLCDTCAYVGSYAQSLVTIVDVADPSAPFAIGTIPLPEGAQPVEVRALPERDLLVVADERLGRLYTFGISDCARPVLQSIFQLPGSPHEFFLWYDDTRVLAYAALFDEAPPELMVVDLTDPATPFEAGRWSAGAEGAAGLLHSVSVSPAGDRAYLALWDGGLLVAQIDLPEMALYRDEGNAFAAAAIPNTHSVVPLGDPRYVVMAGEVFDCPFEGLALADVADPSHPQIVSRFRLPENSCAGLPGGDPTYTPHNPTVIGDWVVTTWYAAGLQVIDWNDRMAPVRTGQFVPSTEGAAPRSLLGTYPVQSFSYPILSDGLFYFTDSSSGLYIVRYTGPGAEEIAAVALAESNRTVRP